MKKSVTLFLFALMCMMGSSLQTKAQSVPEPSAMWTFNDAADLMAASKGSLQLVPAVLGDHSISLCATPAEANITVAEGPSSANKAIMVPAASALAVQRGEGSELLSTFTVMIDVKVPDSAPYDGLFQMNTSNSNDGDFFIHSGNIGVGTLGYGGTVENDTWYRIIINAKDGQFASYLNGELIKQVEMQGRWEIEHVFYVFADEDGEKNDSYLAKLAFWETPLTEEQIAALGTPAKNLAGEPSQISTPEELVAFSAAVNSGASQDAFLTADIDMSGIDFTPIGTQANLYKGTFDGQGHIISNLSVTKGVDASGAMGGVADGYAGLFGAVTGGATIKNFTLKNASIHGTAFVATIGGSYGSGVVTINGVGFEGEAVGANQNVAGIIGVNMGSSANFQISNCYATGKVQGGNESAAISGWTGGGSVNNCWSTAEVTGQDGGNYMFRGGPSNSGIYTGNGVQGTQITAEQLASGEITFALNGNKSEGIWRQTLGTDAYPVLTAASKPVYVVAADYKCDGTPLGDKTFTNDEVIPTYPEHEYEGYTCKNCGQINTEFVTPNSKGIYHLDNAEQLAWFAEMVNAGNTTMNAYLTADVDMSAYPTEKHMIGRDGQGYAGTFDGLFHTVKVAYVNNRDGGTEVNHSSALFRFVNGATINNIITTGTIDTNQKYASGLVGKTQGSPSLFQNVSTYVTINSTLSGDGTHAGLLGVADAPATITNALSAAVINGANTNSCGGLSGWASQPVTFHNCLMIGEINVLDDGSATFSRNPGGNTYDNCYYKEGVKELQDNGNLTKVTAEQLASGEVCKKLSGPFEGGAWRQTLGVDAAPCLNPSHLGVTMEGDQYVNIVSTTEMKIATAADLLKFANAVNEGKNKMNATLTADIDLQGADWVAIGKGPGYGGAAGTGDITNIGFAGVFDGQGHTISNFKPVQVTDDVCEAIGLFGIVTGTVKNLGVSGVTYSSSKDCRAGGIAGTVVASATSQGLVENCFVINSSIVTDQRVCGGVAGAVYGGTVQNCFAANNTLAGYGDRFGGVAGDTRSDGSWNGTVNNCYTDYGRVTSSQSGTTTASQANVTAEQFANGEIAGLLGSAWYQNIGEDPYPVLDPTHGVVAGQSRITGIEKATADEKQETVIYDLSGRRVEKTTKGLYIINGKKVLVK